MFCVFFVCCVFDFSVVESWWSDLVLGGGREVWLICGYCVGGESDFCFVGVLGGGGGGDCSFSHWPCLSTMMHFVMIR